MSEAELNGTQEQPTDVKDTKEPEDKGEEDGESEVPEVGYVFRKLGQHFDLSPISKQDCSGPAPARLQQLQSANGSATQRRL